MPPSHRDPYDDARMLPNRPAGGASKFRASACALIMTCAAAGLVPGCDGTEGTTGGGAGGGVGDGGAMEAEAEVVLQLDSESAESLDVSAFTLFVDELRLRSDRGVDYDPLLTGVGPISLLMGGETVAFPSAPPATYSRVELTLDAGTEPALVASISFDGQPIDLIIESPVSLVFDCEAPVSTAPGDRFEVDLELSLEGLAMLLATAELPPAQGGVVVVDASTAPALVGDIVGWLESGWAVSCEIADEVDGGAESL